MCATNLEVDSPDLDASFFASAIHTHPGESLVDTVKSARCEKAGCEQEGIANADRGQSQAQTEATKP